jgi:hypothetical protein
MPIVLQYTVQKYMPHKLKLLHISIAVPEPIPIQRKGEHGSIPASDAVN